MTTGKTIALTRWTFVGKVMPLLFNMLSRLVIAFLPRSKCLLILWLQSPSAVILEPQNYTPLKNNGYNLLLYGIKRHFHAVLMCVLVAKSFTTLCDPQTVDCQAPLSMGFSRPQYWSELPFPTPGDLPNPKIGPRSPTLQADSLPPELSGKPLSEWWCPLKCLQLICTIFYKVSLLGFHFYLSSRPEGLLSILSKIKSDCLS